MSTLSPGLPHSRLALTCVIAAHVAVTLAAVELMKRKPLVDPVPVTIALMREELPVDQTSEPLPMAPKPLPRPRESPPEPKQLEQPPPPEVERKPPEVPPPPEPTPVAEKPPPPIEPVPQPPAPQAITTPALPPVVTAAAPPTAEPSRPPVSVPPPPEQIDSAPVFNAAYLNNPTPVYPPVSRRMGEQGLVLLRVFVTARGDANAVEVKAGCGHPRLDRAAQDAVKQWKFVPAKRGEQPVDAWVVVPIRFSLKG